MLCEANVFGKTLSPIDSLISRDFSACIYHLQSDEHVIPGYLCKRKIYFIHSSINLS